MSRFLRALAHRRHNTIDSIGIAMGAIAISRGDWIFWLIILAIFVPASIIVEHIALGGAA